MFTSPRGELHRRSNFGRRALRPAADGNRYLAAPPVRLEPAKPGLTFHGLRHSHKTWMIADGVPEVAQSRRLGHILDDKIQETYSHVAAEVEHRLLEALKTAGTKPSPTARHTGVARHVSRTESIDASDDQVPGSAKPRQCRRKVAFRQMINSCTGTAQSQ